MCMSTVRVVYGQSGSTTSINSFFDDGSTCSAILNKVAERLQLWGDPVTLELGTVNATTVLETKLYCVELLDLDGNRHIIKAFGLEKLSGELPVISLDGIKHQFSKTVQGNWDKFARPTGEVELLIGSEVAHLHPRPFETVGMMVVKTSIFGSGWLLNGIHENVKCSSVDMTDNVQILRTGCFRSNKIVAAYSQRITFNDHTDVPDVKTERDFFAGESLGCEPPRRCKDCQDCTDCGFRGETMWQREYAELQTMESNI